MKRLVEFVINSKSTGIISDPDFVDLGLTVLWGKCNIGADNPYEDGHYYQWGGLEPMNNKECNWTNCPFNDGDNYFDDVYFNSILNKVCKNDILSKEYDIAYQTYKDNKVHIPTREQFKELISDTDFELIDNYQNEGRNCWKFTNKTDKNKFIVVPISGWIQGPAKITRLNDSFCIWSSTLRDVNYRGFAHNLSGTLENLFLDTDCRCIGASIRPVKDK